MKGRCGKIEEHGEEACSLQLTVKKWESCLIWHNSARVMCEPGPTFKLSQALVRRAKCALSSIHHSLITDSLTYTQTHTHTQKKTIHECWYGLIHALNTRLDASETHLSPCSCVEMTLSASVGVCVRLGSNAIRMVSGQSNSPSNDWSIIWLTRRLPPRLGLFFVSHRLSSIYSFSYHPNTPSTPFHPFMSTTLNCSTVLFALPSLLLILSLLIM